MSAASEVESVGDVCILQLKDAGTFEFENIAQTSETFDRFIAQSDCDKLIVDCGQIEFWSSLALGIIVSKNAKAEQAGKQLMYCNLNPKSIWSIQAARLHTILNICYDREHALAEYGQTGPETAT